jgi:hypothetical protein
MAVSRKGRATAPRENTSWQAAEDAAPNSSGVDIGGAFDVVFWISHRWRSQIRISRGRRYLDTSGGGIRARQFAEHDVTEFPRSDGAFAIANTTATH